MVDTTGLKIIGWLFGSTTAAVMLVAGFLVTDQIRSAPTAGFDGGATVTLASSAE